MTRQTTETQRAKIRLAVSREQAARKRPTQEAFRLAIAAFLGLAHDASFNEDDRDSFAGHAADLTDLAYQLGWEIPVR